MKSRLTVSGHLLAIAVTTSALLTGCPTMPGAHGSCEFTGKEKYVLYFNGAPMGTFEAMDAPPSTGGRLVLQRGLFADGSILEAWKDHNETNPPVPETHDLHVARVKDDGTWDRPYIVYTEANIRELNGGETSGNSDLPRCWQINKVTFRVESSEPVKGNISR